MKPNLEQIKNKAGKEILASRGLKDLDKVYKKYLGKKGEVAKVFALLKELSGKEKKELGKQANLLKNELTDLLAQKTKAITRQEMQLMLGKEKIDITRPGQKIERGHLHPLTFVQREILSIFQSMGFEVTTGPEIETEWYNFDALNIPENHPARDMWDTFWLRQNVRGQIPDVGSWKSRGRSQRLLLRTHTSPVQVRYMETHQPPLKIVVPGRVFRHEATDVSHELNFYQLEGLMVDEQISVANFKAIITEVLTQFFKKDIKIRLRPSYFPFVEPGFEIDVSWQKGKWPASNVSRSDAGWLELMGAGMAHPNVFEAAGYKAGEWQGFAFGCGIDRLAMIKYGVNDIRLFYQNDLRFLKQF